MGFKLIIAGILLVVGFAMFPSMHTLMSAVDTTELSLKTEILRPNAAGDETSISNQFPVSGEHWDKVDEAGADENTYLQNSGTLFYQRDLYNLPTSLGTGTINFIKIYFRCYGSGSQAKPSLKSNSTITDGNEINLTSNWITGSQQWDTNSGATWTWDDIDALQIGVSLKAGNVAFNVYCTQVYVEVNYIAPTIMATFVKFAPYILFGLIFYGVIVVIRKKGG